MGWSTFHERIEKSKMKYYIRLDYIEALRWPKKMRWTEERGKTTKDYKKRVRKLKIPWKEGERSKQLEREEIPNTQRQMKGIIEKEVKRKGRPK